MTMSYRIRAYQSGDREAVATLLTRLWSPDPAVNSRYLRWRYECNPCEPSLIAVCEHREGLVAARGAYGMRWRAAESNVFMPCVGDTVVARSHEGRGLVQRLTRWLQQALAERDIRFVVNQSPGLLVEKISLRSGWRKAAEWQAVRAFGAGARGAEGFERLDANAVRPVARNGVRICGEQATPRELAGLAARCPTPRIAHCTDEGYFQWRFENPCAEYRRVTAWTDRLAGCLILGRSLYPARGIRILYLNGDDAHVQATLLDQVLRWGEFRSVRTWWNRLPSKVMRVLRDHGFAAARYGERRQPSLLIAATDESIKEFNIGGLDTLDSRNWEPRMMHSDAT